MVADRDRRGLVVAGDVSTTTSRVSAWSMALVTRLRTIRSTRRTSASARHGWSGASTTTPDAALVGQRPGLVDDPVGDVDQVDVVGLEHGGAGVEAADLEQVGQQRLEAVELGLQQLGGAGGGRVEAARASCSTSPAIRTVVSGVRSSWETSETNRRWTRLSSSSWRIWRCRLAPSG